MPTDLGDKEQAQARATLNAMVLICFIICLVLLALLLVDESFSRASVKLMSPFVELRP
jgi:Na+-driven multidrug efflux pump